MKITIQTQPLPVTITAEALLFDMDGVLIDSMPCVERVWRAWARERGFDPGEVAARAHGRPSLATIRDYLPDSDHEAENREVERREIADLSGIEPLPGALQLLASLPPDRWAIVTSCTRPLAAARLQAGGLPQPKIFITATDVNHGKPHPEPYIKAAQALGFPIEHCLVIEDVPAGIQSGHAAGAQVIGVASSLPPEILRQAGANWVVPNCLSIALFI